MTGDHWTDWVSAALLLFGAFLCLSAGIGALRFPDVLARMHSGSKPMILGLASVLAAIVFQRPDLGTITTVSLVMFFQAVMVPVSTHMMGRAAYRTKHVRRSSLYRDELTEVVERAERARLQREARAATGESEKEHE